MRDPRILAGRRVPLVAALCLLATPLAAASGEDGCPTPKVEVRNAWEGSYLIRGAAPIPGDAGMNELVLNLLIEANRDRVRFYEQAGVRAPDVDFVLTADAMPGEDGQLVTTLSLVDVKGRPVRAPVQARYTRDDFFDTAVAQSIAAPMNPLIFYLRSHQMRIRETEHSAIYAAAEITPGEAELAQGETLSLDILLTDCGPEPVPLPDRELRFEHHGPGRLDAETVTTDAEGRAQVVFQATRGGSARVIPVWQYENTSGIPNVAVANWADLTIESSWTLEAEVIAERRMSTHGRWQGRFRLVDGERVTGDGTITTTVTGSCVSGTAVSPITIRGRREGETLLVTIVGDFDDDSEPEVETVDSMECMLRTLTELPAFFDGLAELTQRMLEAERACPLRVPMDHPAPVVECAGVSFRVRRNGGG